MLSEIARWQTYTEDERRSIMERCQQTYTSPVSHDAAGLTEAIPSVTPDYDLRPFVRAQEIMTDVERSLGAQPGAESTLIAVLDAESRILAVNAEWRAFAEANGAASWEKVGVGRRYLSVCEGATGECDSEAAQFALGLRHVMDGRTPFYELVSPCHSPNEQRWFAGRVEAAPEPGFFVVTHRSVTAQYQKAPHKIA